MTKLEIVERSSGYWIVDSCGVAWDEPFIHLSQAIIQLEKMQNKTDDQKVNIND